MKNKKTETLLSAFKQRYTSYLKPKLYKQIMVESLEIK